MKKWIHFLALILLAPVLMPTPSHGEGDERRGANSYRQCVACHSLEPGVHLTGPSLAGLWGQRAAAAKAYGRYSAALSSLDLVWDENTLNAWLADPEAMAPGTYMIFRGVEKEGERDDLVAFLKVAMQSGGAGTVVETGLAPESYVQGQVPESLVDVANDRRITAIRHCHNAFFVTTADGIQRPFWETNVRLKTDASERGPQDGPVLVRSGMMGDRISVVFSSVAAIGAFIDTKCE